MIKYYQDNEYYCQERDIDDSIIMQLRDINHIMRALYEGKGSQKRILIILYEHQGTMTQKELTKQLNIQPGSVSEVIAKLEHNGFIRRKPSQVDGRTMSVELTQEGMVMAYEAKKQRQRRHQEMFSCLTQHQKEEFMNLLEIINQDWKQKYSNVKK